MNYIINLHGFGSAGKNSKYKVLNEIFYDRVIAPNLEVEPLLAVMQIEEIMKYLTEKEEKPEKITLVGSSLGGFYALYASTKWDVHCLLINPSTQPSHTTGKHVGEHVNFKTGIKFNWTEEHVNQLKELEKEINYRALDRSKYRVLLGTNDTLILPDETKMRLKGFPIFEFDTDHEFGEAMLREALKKEYIQDIF